MADHQRVHPIVTHLPPAPSSSSTSASPAISFENPKPPNPPPSKPVPPPETYVVQLPKEQVFRFPPPENARKLQAFTRKKNRQGCCLRCCCFAFCVLVLLIIAVAVSAGAIYLVFRPTAPKYTVTRLAMKSINLTSAATISPGFDVSIRAENPNKKIGIYYLKSSTVDVFFNDLKLSGGVLPAFYQPKNNVTVFQTALTGSDIVLGSAVKTALVNAQNQRRVPLVVKIKAPVKIKLGSVKTWEITVKVKCNVDVDALTESAKIVSKKCDYSVRLW